MCVPLFTGVAILRRGSHCCLQFKCSWGGRDEVSWRQINTN